VSWLDRKRTASDGPDDGGGGPELRQRPRRRSHDDE